MLAHAREEFSRFPPGTHLRNVIRMEIDALRVWPWVLTGTQVLALWAAGHDLRWGWLLGGSVQLPWILYAVATSQFGFIPGCMFSASVQLTSWFRRISKPQRTVAT